MRKHVLWTGAGLALFALLLWYFREPLWAGLVLAGDRRALTTLLNTYGGWAQGLSALLLVLQVFIAVIPGQMLMIVNGYVFGFWKGLIITWTSLVLAGEVAFWLARRYGRPVAARFVAPATLEKWDHASFNQSILFYVITMLLPLFPNDVMCYVAGLTPMPPLRFLAANMLARLIASLALVYLGAFGKGLPPWAWGIIASLTTVLVLISWLARRKLWAVAR